MSIKELKEYASGVVKTLLKRKRSHDYIRGQITGMFKLYRYLYGIDSNVVFMEALDAVLDEIY